MLKYAGRINWNLQLLNEKKTYKFYDESGKSYFKNFRNVWRFHENSGKVGVILIDQVEKREFD